MKTVLIGAAAAAMLGAAAGGHLQDQVASVVADSGGSRLDVASFAAPVATTVWAENDPTAPQPPAVYTTASIEADAQLYEPTWLDEPEPSAPPLAPAGELGGDWGPLLPAALEPTDWTVASEQLEDDGPGFGVAPAPETTPHSGFTPEPVAGMIVAGYAP